MIISASRRTDIPAYHFEWFLRRLEERKLLVRNPFNFYQVSQIDLSPEIVDCIVFWTKNPKPMLDKLDRLKEYKYYVQFTINPYGKDLEKNLPSKEELISIFKKLSYKIGKERVIWRYSPIILNDKYTEEFHYEKFADFARQLSIFTNQCNVSFIEMYKKITKRMTNQGIKDIPQEIKERMLIKFKEIADKYNIELKACGNVDLERIDVAPSKCIDDKIISEITGLKYSLKKDKGQDKQCYCVTSVDIGTYNTCLNGCEYCYANLASGAKKKIQGHSLDSPFLCSAPTDKDKITLRKVKKEGK